MPGLFHCPMLCAKLLRLDAAYGESEVRADAARRDSPHPNLPPRGEGTFRAALYVRAVPT